MTIVYLKEKFPPPPFDVEVEQMQYFRDLYEGNHENIFPRAQELAKQGQITKSDLRKSRRKYYKYNADKLAQKHAVHHYVIINFASVIAELPADLINRSLGNVSADTENDKELLTFVQNVSYKSKLNQKIWSAVVQHQVDGGVAYRIRRDVKGTWFEWKPADLYFEHEDGPGADIAWIEIRGKENYLRVERQRIEDNQLSIQQLVFSMSEDSIKEEIDIKDYAVQFNLAIPDNQTFESIGELMCGFVPNDETLLIPRGRSGLRNIDVIQEEINWTITRDSIVFEMHGKPKLAIPRALWDNVANKNQKYYGERFVRNADLEVVSYDEKNGAVPMYITWDAKTEQSFNHVKSLIDRMLAISKTSLQAAGMDNDTGGRSAIAILYEWIQSVIKSEAIRDKFDIAIKDALRKCIILENALGGTNYSASDPVIEWQDMLPKAESEVADEEIKKYSEGVQSLETTVRNLHPSWSEKAIAAEVEKIQEEQATDSFSPTFTQPPKANVGES
ncbi:phage portal protein [Metabacillus bambusae]|uniref:Phage portal protein n=1 Tax=Metabacillus bambusae TaxID=2795218 RepID=A0ABS3N9Z3_9BACI|nr:phage portal protein [Metabacillus bambusae]MBO1515043.1 phage portal protein [Metabacillus bambusae]